MKNKHVPVDAEKVVCPDCQGEGFVKDKVCDTCYGTGEINPQSFKD